MKLLFIVIFGLLVQNCSTTIRGYVVQEDGQVVGARGAKVNISFLDGPGQQQVLDLREDGFFVTKEKLQQGHYLIEPLIPGYMTNSLRIFIDESKSIKILAKPLDQNPSKSIQIQRDNRMDRGSGSARLTPPKM